MTGNEKVRAFLYHLLDERLETLERMLHEEAPDFLVSSQLTLIGKIGPLLCPERAALDLKAHLENKARRRAGVCTMPGCDSEADIDGDDDMCKECASHCDDNLAAMLVANGVVAS